VSSAGNNTEGELGGRLSSAGAAFGKLCCRGSTEDPRCGGRGWSRRRRSCSPATNRYLVWRAPHGTKAVFIGQKRPLKPKDVWAIRVRLQLEQRKRDLALFNLAIDSKLRGYDLVRLRVNDVCVGGQIRDRATVIQQKTGRPVQFEVTEQTRAAIHDWLANTGPASNQYLFPSRFHGQPHISTRQYARIVHRWVERAGLASSAYGTHSLRANQGGTDLQEDRQLEGGAATTRAHEARKHRPLSRHRSRRCAQHLGASRALIQHKCGPVSGGAAISSFRRPSTGAHENGKDTPKGDHREGSIFSLSSSLSTAKW
jgi:integrase-like protein